MIAVKPATKSDRRLRLSPNVSVLLDLLRFAAAVIVAVTHLSSFVQADPLLPGECANAAVCVFFVLSGFVIRFVTRTREKNPAEYWIDRVSRIYSVVAPALLLTVVFEGTAFFCNPVVYHRYSQPYTWAQVPMQLLNNITFTSGYWGYGNAPLSNLPFWSLTYECVYYVLFGLIHFTKKARWFTIPALLLLVGPSIALLFTVWWMGVVLFDVYEWLQSSRKVSAIAAVISSIGLALCFAIRKHIGNFLHKTDYRWRRSHATQFASSTPVGQRLFHGSTVPWLDRLSFSFFVTGTVFCLAVVVILVASEALIPEVSSSLARAVRTVADSTFTLYVIHVPLFILLFTIAGGPASGWPTASVAFAAAVLLSVALAIQFDRLKLWLRGYLRNRFSTAMN